MTTETTRRLRAYRFALDPTDDQLSQLAQHAGAARWAFNHALAAKLEAHNRWQLQVDELVTLGYTEKQARKEATVKVPSKPVIQKTWNQLKGDESKNIPGICAWWKTVSTYAFQSAFMDADQAWQNWMNSISGRRAGRRVGIPKFKKKGRARDSVRLYGSNIRLETYRRLNVPKIGDIRMHESGKRMQRSLNRGSVIKSVTLSRGGHRWYASVLVDEPFTPPEPTRRQVKAGKVGINFGVYQLAALSTGEIIDNPRHLDGATKKIHKAQRALSRTEKGSQRRVKAAKRLGRLHHQVAEQRTGNLHHITKRLTTQYGEIAIQDLDLITMTGSGRGTIDQPGKGVRYKAQRNRSVLDAAFGEARRQLTYKTGWYGSRVALCDRYEPVDQDCSNCGATKAKMPLTQRTYTCSTCGMSLDRDVNAARNIAARATPVAPDTEETINARGGAVSPTSGEAGASETGRPGP